MVQQAVDSAGLTLPDVDALVPRMLDIDEYRYRSVRFFRDPATKAWKLYEPWMTTIVDLDTGQVLGIVDGRDSEGVGDAAAGKDRLPALVERAVQPETNRLWRTVCRPWKENEVLIVASATTRKAEANTTAINT